MLVAKKGLLMREELQCSCQAPGSVSDGVPMIVIKSSHSPRNCSMERLVDVPIR
jgi:hypothetical protein